MSDEYDLHAFDRLFDRTIIGPTNCFEFTGCLNEDGYGQIGYRGRVTSAHRLAYFLCVDDIPEDIQVLHKCDNPKCVNPDHLFLGTHKDNMQDRHAKGRAGYVRLRGEQRTDAILTDKDIREIRELSEQGYTQYHIACAFNVSQSNISKVINRKAWAHVD